MVPIHRRVNPLLACGDVVMILANEAKRDTIGWSGHDCRSLVSPLFQRLYPFGQGLTEPRSSDWLIHSTSARIPRQSKVCSTKNPMAQYPNLCGAKGFQPPSIQF